MKHILIIILTLLSLNTFAGIYIDYDGKMRSLEDAIYLADGEVVDIQNIIFSNQSCYIGDFNNVVDNLEYNIEEDEAAFVLLGQENDVLEIAYYDNFSWSDEGNIGTPSRETVTPYQHALFKIYPCKLSF